MQSLKLKKSRLEDQIRLAVEDRNAKICKTEALRDRGETILSTVVELADWIATLKVCFDLKKSYVDFNVHTHIYATEKSVTNISQTRGGMLLRRVSTQLFMF